MTTKNDFLRNFCTRIESFLLFEEQIQLKLLLSTTIKKNHKNKTNNLNENDSLNSESLSFFENIFNINDERYQENKKIFKFALNQNLEASHEGSKSDSFEEFLLEEKTQKLKSKSKNTGMTKMIRLKKTFKQNGIEELKNPINLSKLKIKKIRKFPNKKNPIKILKELYQPEKKRTKKEIFKNKKVLNSKIFQKQIMPKTGFKLNSTRVHILDSLDQIRNSMSSFFKYNFCFENLTKNLMLLSEHLKNQFEKKSGILQLNFLRDLSHFLNCFDQEKISNFYKNRTFANLKIALSSNQIENIESICFSTIKNKLLKDISCESHKKNQKIHKKEIEILSNYFTLLNIESFLTRLITVELQVAKTNSINLYETILINMKKNTNFKNPSINGCDCCSLFHQIEFLILSHVYISSVSFKNIMNIPILLKTKKLIKFMILNPFLNQFSNTCNEESHLFTFVSKLNEYFAHQILLYSSLFKKEKENWKKNSITKNLKIMNKIFEKFSKLSQSQIAKILKVQSSQISFPERPNMNILSLVNLLTNAE